MSVTNLGYCEELESCGTFLACRFLPSHLLVDQEIAAGFGQQAELNAQEDAQDPLQHAVQEDVTVQGHGDEGVLQVREGALMMGPIQSPGSQKVLRQP